MGEYFDGQKFMGSVKVGAKGQIVIPKEVRDMFGINPGDSLLFLADREHGMAMDRIEVFDKIADSIFSGKGKDVYPDHADDDTKNFAQAIKNIEKSDINGSN